tara:strand:- start:79 stop:267 length:189 start_codon:yes stop_codon:yes gene_type:complete
MKRYFKKPNGDIIQAPENQELDNLKSWESRFIECDAKGDEIKKEKKISKPKAKKKEKVKNGE